ncbi:MAG: FAD:protein FMN transferase [Planctomycetes bacterium]|nr:FAD:protein FMN transferase [Planctomycetota bacterium]
MLSKHSVFFCLFLIVAFGCSKAEKIKYQKDRLLLSTQISITVFAEDENKAAKVTNAAFQKISELEVLLNKHNNNSDIARLNQSSPQKSKVNPITFDIINKSVGFGNISRGAFDITVEPILRLWREAENKNALPSSDELKATINLTGYGNIILDPKSLEVGFSKQGMSIDIGGIAKGYIVGEAIKVLKSEGVSNGLIVAGGDLYALGNNPEKGADWLIGIRNPLKPEENLKYIGITDKAVATSGHYMRFYTVQGKKYSHIIDPRNGWPVEEKLASVTVIASDGTAADALATMICVLGPEEGLKLAKSIPDAEVFIITSDGEKLTFLQTEGFAKFLKQN